MRDGQFDALHIKRSLLLRNLLNNDLTRLLVTNHEGGIRSGESLDSHSFDSALEIGAEDARVRQSDWVIYFTASRLLLTTNAPAMSPLAQSSHPVPVQ